MAVVRFRLCGHSYGGNVALHAAIARPMPVQSLVLSEPVFFRALYLAREQQALEAAVRFFSTYADRVERGEAAAVAEMIDYWIGADLLNACCGSCHADIWP
jgi:pimeloyl-ACP methyl ester carboxylesterase